MTQDNRKIRYATSHSLSCFDETWEAFMNFRNHGNGRPLAKRMTTNDALMQLVKEHDLLHELKQSGYFEDIETSMDINRRQNERIQDRVDKMKNKLKNVL